MKNPRTPVMVDHGTATRYRYGCRCDACKAAERVYAAERAAQRVRTREPWYAGRTSSVYSRTPCACGQPKLKDRKKCDACRGVSRVGLDPIHGTRATYRDGCRCDPCTAANREYQRRDRDRREARGLPRSYARTGSHPRLDAAESAARQAAFDRMTYASETRVCQCGRCGSAILEGHFVTNGHGATLAVCPRCDWHAPAASTRGAA